MACSTEAGVIACATTSQSVAIITSLIVTTIETTFTTTRQLITTFEATPGETVILTPNWPSPSPSSFTTTSIDTARSSSQTTSSAIITIMTPIVTATEIVVVVQGVDGILYTTSTLTFPLMNTTGSLDMPHTPVTVVVGRKHESGWNTWSDSEKGGLIAGCVLAFLVLLFLCLCWSMRRKKTWIAGTWHVNSHPGHIAGHSTYGHGYP